MLAERGATVIDADVLSREAVRPDTQALKDIVKRWGKDVIKPDGTLDRKALRQIVFADQDELDALNRIVHPGITRLRDREIALDDHALIGMRSKPLWDLLVSLTGVGPKTAACVLLFSLGRPYFPVDTHVHRVARRLGLVEESADAVVAQEVLQAAVPPNEMYALHMHLIRHGREVCVARRPLCSQCVLSSLCPRIGVIDAR